MGEKAVIRRFATHLTEGKRMISIIGRERKGFDKSKKKETPSIHCQSILHRSGGARTLFPLSD